MKVLVVHNHYQQAGGEDAVVRDEVALLRHFGHEVLLHERSNEELNALPAFGKVSRMLRMDWSDQSCREIRGLIREFKPQVVHFHNIFFMLTPSVYYACREEKVPVVQSLHNFRMLCANGLLFRDGGVCEDCLTKSRWEGVKHGCYRNSPVLSFLVGRMSQEHRRRKTWERCVDRYVTATEFTRRKYIANGLAADKVLVKPHFVYPDPGLSAQHEGYALFAGRLSEEKGVAMLLAAWEKIKDFPLRVLGDGPLSGKLKDLARQRDIKNVEFLGFLSPEEYGAALAKASFVVIPSICYENFPRMVVEAYSRGIPVVASRLGSMEEIVKDGRTGLLFEPGKPEQLIDRCRFLIDNPAELVRLRRSARQEYEERYTIGKNHEQLMHSYQQAIHS